MSDYYKKLVKTDIDYESQFKEDAKNHKMSILKYAKSIKRTPVERLLTFVNNSRYKIKYWDEETIDGLVKILKKEIDFNGVRSPLLFKISFNSNIKYSIAVEFLKLFEFYMPFICNDGTLVQNSFVFFSEDIEYYYEDFFKNNYLDYYLSMNQSSRRNLIIYLRENGIYIEPLLKLEPNDMIKEEFDNSSLNSEKYSVIDKFPSLKNCFVDKFDKLVFDKNNIDVFSNSLQEILMLSLLREKELFIELKCSLPEDFTFNIKDINYCEYLTSLNIGFKDSLKNSLKAVEDTAYNIINKLPKSFLSLIIEDVLYKFLKTCDKFNIVYAYRKFDLFNLLYMYKNSKYKIDLAMFKEYISSLLKVYNKDDMVGLYFLYKTDFKESIYTWNLLGKLTIDKDKLLLNTIYPLIHILKENRIENISNPELLESLVYFISDFIAMENMNKYTYKEKEKLIEMVNISIVAIHNKNNLDVTNLASVLQRCYKIKSSGYDTTMYNISIYSDKTAEYKLRVLSELSNFLIEDACHLPAYLILSYEQMICKNLYAIFIDEILIKNNENMYKQLCLLIKILNKLSVRLIQYKGLDDSYILILSVEFNYFIKKILNNDSNNISSSWISDNLNKSVNLIGGKLYEYMNSLRHELVKTNYNSIRGFYHNEKLKNLPSIKKERNTNFKNNTFFIDKISFYKECIEALISLNKRNDSSLFILNFFDMINTIHRIHPKSSISLYDTNYFYELFPYLTLSHSYKYMNDTIIKDKEKILLKQISIHYPLLQEELAECEELYGKEELAKIVNKYFYIGFEALFSLKKNVGTENVTLVNEYLNINEIMTYLYSLCKKMELPIDDKIDHEVIEHEILSIDVFNRNKDIDNNFKLIEGKFKKSKARIYRIALYTSNIDYLSIKNINSSLDVFCLEKELSGFVSPYRTLPKVIKIKLSGFDINSNMILEEVLTIEITNSKRFINSINSKIKTSVNNIDYLETTFKEIKENIINKYKTIESEVYVLNLSN